MAAATRAIAGIGVERSTIPAPAATQPVAVTAGTEGASNFAAAKAFVEYGLQQKQDGKRESASGPGSSLVTAEPCLNLLNEIIPKLGITSILDLGCGDWNWMQNAAWRSNPNVRYEGWEAHEGLVNTLNASFGNERTSFRVGDLTTEAFPKVDLIICRDVFFHLPLHISEGVIRRIRANGGLFLSTSFLDEASNSGIGRAYLKIQNWGFYRINLDISPFDLRPHRVSTVVEPKGIHQGKARSVCLYDFRSA
jgi:SAM-dependent methyltransferase